MSGAQMIEQQQKYKRQLYLKNQGDRDCGMWEEGGSRKGWPWHEMFTLT